MKKTILILFFICISYAFCLTSIAEGEIFGELLLEDSPFVVQNNIEIPADSILTINPGITIFFNESVEFKVYGSLNINGSENEPVVFTVADTTGYHDNNIDDGSWNGLRFYDSTENDSTYVSYLKISYCKQSHSSIERGAIYLENYSNAVFNDVEMFKCKSNLGSAGFNLKNSSIEINYAKIHNIYSDGYGSAIAFKNNSNARMTNSKIVNNTSLYRGAGVYCNNSNPTLINVLIANNSAERGTALMLSESNPALINCTIAYNLATRKSGGIYCLASSPTIENCILYANRVINTDENREDDIYIYDTDSSPVISNSLVRYGQNSIRYPAGATFTYTNNIEGYPDFNQAPVGAGNTENVLNLDFGLENNSRCRNSGNPLVEHTELDIIKNPRIVNSIDIGAYENQEFVSTEQNIYTKNDISIYPNPFNPSTTVSLTIDKPQHVNLAVYNIKGQKVKQVVNKTLSAKAHHFKLDLNKYSSGVYFVKTKINNRVKTKKMLMLK